MDYGILTSNDIRGQKEVNYEKLTQGCNFVLMYAYDIPEHHGLYHFHPKHKKEVKSKK